MHFQQNRQDNTDTPATVPDVGILGLSHHGSNDSNNDTNIDRNLQSSNFWQYAPSTSPESPPFWQTTTSTSPQSPSATPTTSSFKLPMPLFYCPLSCNPQLCNCLNNNNHNNDEIATLATCAHHLHNICTAQTTGMDGYGIPNVTFTIDMCVSSNDTEDATANAVGYVTMVDCKFAECVVYNGGGRDERNNMNNINGCLCGRYVDSCNFHSSNHSSIDREYCTAYTTCCQKDKVLNSSGGGDGFLFEWEACLWDVLNVTVGDHGDGDGPAGGDGDSEGGRDEEVETTNSSSDAPPSSSPKESDTSVTDNNEDDEDGLSDKKSTAENSGSSSSALIQRSNVCERCIRFLSTAALFWIALS